MNTPSTSRQPRGTKATNSLTNMRQSPNHDDDLQGKENQKYQSSSSKKVTTTSTSKKITPTTAPSAKTRKVLGELSASEIQSRSAHSEMDENRGVEIYNDNAPSRASRIRVASRDAIIGARDQTRTSRQPQPLDIHEDLLEEQENISPTRFSARLAMQSQRSLVREPASISDPGSCTVRKRRGRNLLARQQPRATVSLR